jgi:hypothetical protein
MPLIDRKACGFGHCLKHAKELNPAELSSLLAREEVGYDVAQTRVARRVKQLGRNKIEKLNSVELAQELKRGRKASTSTHSVSAEVKLRKRIQSAIGAYIDEAPDEMSVTEIRQNALQVIGAFLAGKQPKLFVVRRAA